MPPEKYWPLSYDPYPNDWRFCSCIYLSVWGSSISCAGCNTSVLELVIFIDVLNQRVVHLQVTTVFRVFVTSMSKTFDSPPTSASQLYEKQYFGVQLGPWVSERGARDLSLFLHPLPPLLFTNSRKLIYENPKYGISSISDINYACH